MTATLTIDGDGGVLLPSAFLEQFRLKPGAKLQADLGADSIALRPIEQSDQDATVLVERDGFLVFCGSAPFDAAEAVLAARETRAAALLPGEAR